MQAIIFGASRQGGIILDVLRAQGEYQVIGFLDDDASKQSAVIHNVPVLGGMDWALANRAARNLKAIVAIGNNEARVVVGNKLRAMGFELINAIHPSAVLMSNVSLGSGIFINAGAILVTGSRLHDDVVMNTGATIDHDSLLCTGAQLAPGVHTAGCITVNRQAVVGVGSILGPNVTIGERSIVGAGSVVLSDIPADVMAFGSPAKVVKEVTQPIDWRKILSGQ